MQTQQSAFAIHCVVEQLFGGIEGTSGRCSGGGVGASSKGADEQSCDRRGECQANQHQRNRSFRCSVHVAITAGGNVDENGTREQVRKKPSYLPRRTGWGIARITINLY